MTKKKAIENNSNTIKKKAAKKTAKKSAVKGKKGFQKGVSGNPGGRPKKNQELAQAARDIFEGLKYVNPITKKKTVGGMAVLAAIATSGFEKASDRLKAIDILLDRGWGKAPQEIKLGQADDRPVVEVIITK